MKRCLPILLLLLCGSAYAQAPWPGQSGNAVGYAAYGSGTLTATACGAFSSGSSWATSTLVHDCTYSSFQTINCNFCIFQSVDFKGTGNTAGTFVSGSNILFVGDRFQSNDVANYNIQTTGANLYFFYCSVTPLASFATSPPGSLWPSAGAGTNSTTITGGTNAINGNSGYQIGFNITAGGPVTIDHSDIWGYGNAVVYYSTTAQMILTNNWIHDPADPSLQAYHTDGPGYLNGGTGPSNVEIIGNVAAMLGNTNSLAFQAATAGYSNIIINSNYWSGNEDTISPGDVGAGQHFTNSTFFGNVFGTDVEPAGAISHGFTFGTNFVWACNTIAFR